MCRLARCRERCECVYFCRPYPRALATSAGHRSEPTGIGHLWPVLLLRCCVRPANTNVQRVSFSVDGVAHPLFWELPEGVHGGRGTSVHHVDLAEPVKQPQLDRLGRIMMDVCPGLLPENILVRALRREDATVLRPKPNPPLSGAVVLSMAKTPDVVDALQFHEEVQVLLLFWCSAVIRASSLCPLRPCDPWMSQSTEGGAWSHVNTCRRKYMEACLLSRCVGAAAAAWVVAGTLELGRLRQTRPTRGLLSLRRGGQGTGDTLRRDASVFRGAGSERAGDGRSTLAL